MFELTKIAHLSKKEGIFKKIESLKKVISQDKKNKIVLMEEHKSNIEML